MFTNTPEINRQYKVNALDLWIHGAPGWIEKWADKLWHLRGGYEHFRIFGMVGLRKGNTMNSDAPDGAQGW